MFNKSHIVRRFLKDNINTNKMEKEKRITWKDKEIYEMLSIIKEKHVIKLLDGKQKRNKTIYEAIQKDLEEKSIYKTEVQIRAKFKSLKAEYYKMKRNNNTSGAGRMTSPYFCILDEILSDRPVNNIGGVDTSKTCTDEENNEGEGKISEV